MLFNVCLYKAAAKVSRFFVRDRKEALKWHAFFWRFLAHRLRQFCFLSKAFPDYLFLFLFTRSIFLCRCPRIHAPRAW